MRISSFTQGAAFFSVALILAGSVQALDQKSVGCPEAEPAESLGVGLDAYYNRGDKSAAFDALRAAADSGSPKAQWKLGRMYAEGDGIKRDEVKAFELFSEVADAFADILEQDCNRRDAPFVADAFVALGSYLRKGIPDSRIKPNFNRARQMFAYAASYFGDPDAQLNLAVMYFEGEGGDRDPRQAAGWAKLSADKGNVEAQALLGHLLFEGDGVGRQPVLGLMFLSVALDRSGGHNIWIREMHEQAFSLATEAERRTAEAFKDAWISKNSPKTAAAN